MLFLSTKAICSASDKRAKSNALHQFKKLAAALSGPAQIDRHYRRLQRFFSSDLSPHVFTQLIVQPIVRPGKRVFIGQYG